MDIDSLLRNLLEDPDHFTRYVHLLRCWPSDELQDYVERRKNAADAQWSNDPTISLAYANEIIGIGCLLDNVGYQALGLMARGDAIKLIGRYEEAWNTLELAGEFYRSIGDEVGWGRTRIGRLGVSTNVNRIQEALADVQIARTIFERHGKRVRAMRLDMNIAYVHNQIGNYQQALTGYECALETAISLGEEGAVSLWTVYTGLGYAHAHLGRLRQADQYHQQAHTSSAERGDILHMTISQNNLAHIALLQGRYRDALNWLHTSDAIVNNDLPVEQVHALWLLIECYVSLNRYEEVRQYALNTKKLCLDRKMMIQMGLILLCLGTAEAELGNLMEALAAIEEAESIFKHLDAHSRVANSRLRWAQLVFKQGEVDRAQSEVTEAIEHFQTANEQINLASAILLGGQIAAARQDWEMASDAALKSLKIAWKCHAPWLRYSSQLLLGQVAEAQEHTDTAIRRYRAAAGTVERLQRDLTITLRPGFLGNKEEALHRLIRLHLNCNQPAAAWTALERAKSQTLLNHLLNRDHLRWAQTDPRAEPLIQELERLREDYAGFDQLVQDMPLDEEKAMDGVAPEDAKQMRLEIEAQIRRITEQLYLINGGHPARTAASPCLRDIQRRLGDDEVMVEFYSHDQTFCAFVIDQHCIRSYPLKITSRELRRALNDLEFDRDVALEICAAEGPTARNAKDQIPEVQSHLQRLYQFLITPIAAAIEGKRRVTVVPYGILHYLPFHLLHDGSKYWIERSEIVILPAAGLMLAESPRSSGGALVLADDHHGHLPQTPYEGQVVSDTLGGELFCNEGAVRRVLAAKPRQVLHIAAHGKYRMDQPDMSYVHLHDGQLLSDDLFQNDLSYELVTLSACETGRARAVSGDELIGLGRGFFYAGAGALIASLWRIEDELTLRLMNKLYTGLKAGGLSKAAALRAAQLELLEETPDLHPMYWGAFQLIGNAEPLSQGE